MSLINGDTAWAPIDGHEGDWGGYHPMTASYVNNKFTNGRDMVTIGRSGAATNPSPLSLTEEPSSPGSVLYRVDGGAWHEYDGHELTLSEGKQFDLHYNDWAGSYNDTSETVISTQNSGHYDIEVTRTKG